MVEHGAQGVKIGWGSNLAGHDLFGADIGRRAQHHLGGGELGGGRPFGNAKIGEMGLVVVVKDDVVRLDVSVNNVLLVGVAQSARNLANDIHGPWQRHAVSNPRHQVAALHERHGEKVKLANGFHEIEGHNIGMFQGGHHAGFPLETVHRFPIPRFIQRQDLECNPLVQILIHGFVDRSHAPASKSLDDLEMFGQDLFQNGQVHIHNIGGDPVRVCEVQ